jgi:hypothetical protein
MCTICRMLNDANAKHNDAHPVMIRKLKKRFPPHFQKQFSFWLHDTQAFWHPTSRTRIFRTVQNASVLGFYHWRNLQNGDNYFIFKWWQIKDFRKPCNNVHNFEGLPRTHIFFMYKVMACYRATRYSLFFSSLRSAPSTLSSTLFTSS